MNPEKIVDLFIFPKEILNGNFVSWQWNFMRAYQIKSYSLHKKENFPSKNFYSKCKPTASAYILTFNKEL